MVLSLESFHCGDLEHDITCTQHLLAILFGDRDRSVVLIRRLRLLGCAARKIRLHQILVSDHGLDRIEVGVALYLNVILEAFLDSLLKRDQCGVLVACLSLGLGQSEVGLILLWRLLGPLLGALRCTGKNCGQSAQRWYQPSAFLG